MPSERLEIRIGDQVQDCDPRCQYRRGTVFAVGPSYCVIDWNTGRSTVARKRIHTKGIRSGVRLLPREADAE